MGRAKVIFGVSLCVLFGLAGLEAGSAEEETPVRLAVYAAAPKADASLGVTSSVVATTTVKRLLSDVIPTTRKAATDAVWFTTKRMDELVTLVVVHTKPKLADVIQLKDYPLYLLPTQAGKAKYCVSLEIVAGVSQLKGTQTFDPPLTMILTYPDGTRPFLLIKNKKDVLYFDEMGGTLPKDEGFTGTVTKKANSYEITVTSWPAGDPCLGGG